MEVPILIWLNAYTQLSYAELPLFILISLTILTSISNPFNIFLSIASGVCFVEYEVHWTIAIRCTTVAHHMGNKL